MHRLFMALSVAFIGILAVDLGTLPPSLAKGKVKQRSNTTIVRPGSARPGKPLSPVQQPIAPPTAGNGDRSGNPDNSVCFLRLTGGNAVKLNQLCGSNGATSTPSAPGIPSAPSVLNAESDRAAEWARQKELNAGH